MRAFVMHILFGLCTLTSSAAIGAPLIELKGAYIINFIKFARFNPEPQELSVCIHNQIQLLEYIKEKLPKTLGNMTISLKNTGNKDDLKGCKVVYLSQLTGLGDLSKSILTITDEDGKGVIEFVERGERLKFSVDVSRASEASISFPAQVLQLAVRKEELSFNEEASAIGIGICESVHCNIADSIAYNIDTWGILS